MAQKMSFILYADDYEDFRDLTPAQKGGLLDALFCHALGETAPDLDPMTEMVFRFLKRKLDRDHDKWQATCAARAEAGRKSGRARAAKASQNATQDMVEEAPEENRTKRTNAPFVEQTRTKRTDSDSDSERERVREHDSEHECVRDGEVVVVTTGAADNDPVYPSNNNDLSEKFLMPETEKQAFPGADGRTEKASLNGGRVSRAEKRPASADEWAFCPPTEEQVQAYCQQRQNGIDAGKFVDYYAARGWRLGKAPMTDWRAAVRGWERRDRPAQAPLVEDAPPLEDWEHSWLDELAARRGT